METFSIIANSIYVGGTIQAQAGTLTLNATGSNVVLPDGTSAALKLGESAYIGAGGYKKTLVDVDTYVRGGKVALQADKGDIALASGSVIDVAQPAGSFGYGGEIEVTAPLGRVALNGELRGRGGPGLGGRFKLDMQGGLDDASFNSLVDRLYAGGLTGAVDIHTQTGNLVLWPGHTLKAHSVTLTADDTRWDAASGFNGQVVIGGTIDATGYPGKTSDGAGQAGGQVELYGYNAVTLASSGRILASTEHADERGGDVTLGIAWGTKSWSASTKTGGIDLQPGSVIDVHGGAKGGLAGGTVTLRAPLDGADDVKIARIGSTIIGARSVTLEGFVTFTTNPTGADGIYDARWDGVIDPAGLANGRWTNLTGWTLTGSSGSGYTSVPTVTLTGGDGNATLVASLKINSWVVTSGGSYDGVPQVTYVLPDGTIATGPAVMGVGSITVSPSYQTFPGFAGASADAIISDGAHQTSARASVDANGVLSFTVTNPGTGFGQPTIIYIPAAGLYLYAGAGDFSSKLTVVGVTAGVGGAGYTAPAGITFSGGGGTGAAAAANMGVDFKITSIISGYSSNIAPTITISGGGGTGASLAVTGSATNLTGNTVNGVFTPDSTFLASTTNKLFDRYTPSAPGIFTADPSGQGHIDFYTQTLVDVVQGRYVNGGNNYGFTGAISRLLVAPDGTVRLTDGANRLDKSVVHFQPGIELINPLSSVNGGNITVASNWNLGGRNGGRSNQQ